MVCIKYYSAEICCWHFIKHWWWKILTTLLSTTFRHLYVLCYYYYYYYGKTTLFCVYKFWRTSSVLFSFFLLHCLLLFQETYKWHITGSMRNDVVPLDQEEMAKWRWRCITHLMKIILLWRQNIWWKMMSDTSNAEMMHGIEGWRLFGWHGEMNF